MYVFLQTGIMHVYSLCYYEMFNKCLYELLTKRNSNYYAFIQRPINIFAKNLTNNNHITINYLHDKNGSKEKVKDTERTNWIICNIYTKLQIRLYIEKIKTSR